MPPLPRTTARSTARTAAPNRRAQSGASAVIALLVLLLSLAVGFGGSYALRRSGSGDALELRVVPPEPTSLPATTAVPESTLGLGTEVPVTTDAPAQGTTSAPAVTAPAAARVDLGTGGALFSQVTDRRLFDDTTGCDSFTASQEEGSSKGCDRFLVGDIEVTWSLDSASDNVDVLWRDPAANQPDVWNVALRADGTGVTRDPRVGDVTGDGLKDIVVGASTAGRLNVDVVELVAGVPTVTLHLSLLGGRVRLGAGELHVWRAVDGAPDTLEHLVLNRDDGAWQVGQRERVKARIVGPSQV